MEIFAEGLRFPEGPVWLPDGDVAVVEIAAGRISAISPNGRVHVIANTGGGPNGAALGPDNKLYVCNNGGFEWRESGGYLTPHGPAADYECGRIEVVDLATGKVERLYDYVVDASGRTHRLSGPNDIVFDDHGGFWFTDIGKNWPRAHDHGGVYYGKTDGSGVWEAAYPIFMANGVGLSPDGQTLYVASSIERTVLTFPVTAPGQLNVTPGLVLGDPLAGFGPRTLLDSLAVCADGEVVVASLMAEPGLMRIDPLTGASRYIPFPDPLTTNVCFGGPELKTAFVTLSATGRLARLAWDKPGLKLPHYS
jgi:gluconolactonase